MKKLIIIMFCLLIVNTGCIKEETTQVYGILYNNSGVNVNLVIYKDGLAQLEKVINLNPNDSFQIGFDTHRGDVQTYGFNSEYINNQIDSIIVTFNDSFKVYHYRSSDIVISHEDKYFLKNEDRNIFNGSNYDLQMVRNNKQKVNYNIYYFTMSDYAFAKD